MTVKTLPFVRCPWNANEEGEENEEAEENEVEKEESEEEKEKCCQISL
jgi:hypothetical protein